MNQQDLEYLKNIDDQIQVIKRAALELKNLSGGSRPLIAMSSVFWPV